MRRIPLFGYFLLLMYLVLFAFFGMYLNNQRLKLAENYLKQSQNQGSLQVKTLFLLKSALLSPSESKKKELITLYYVSEQPKQAEFWIKRLKSGEKNLILAQHYLSTSEKAKFNNILRNQEQKAELLRVSEALVNTEKINELINPKTDLGKLLVDINKGIFQQDGNTYLDVLLSKSIQGSNLMTKVTFSEKLIDSGQLSLARFILTGILQENPELSYVNVLMAKSYDGEGNYKEALSYQIKAIMCDPSISDYYLEGIGYAKKGGFEEDAHYLQETLDRITQLKRS